MLTPEPGAHWFESETGTPSRHNILGINWKVVGMCTLSCLLGTLILWYVADAEGWSDNDTKSIWKFVGIVLNLPLLAFIFKAYHLILGPLATSLMNRGVDDLPMP